VGDEVLFVRYGFSVYPIAARRCGATPVEAPDCDYGTDVDALLAAVTERTRVVFLANPNNPTGSYIGRSELARLHAGLRPDVLLVVDQAYAEYVAEKDDDGALDLARSAANVLVTRTFSKIYGLAGERIGWATGPVAVIDMLNRIRGPFNVSLTGQAMGLAAVQDQAFVQASAAHNRAERARFVAALEQLGNRAAPAAQPGQLRADRVFRRADRRGGLSWPDGCGLYHPLAAGAGAAPVPAHHHRHARADGRDRHCLARHGPGGAMSESFRDVAVIGLGLLGGSVALAARAHPRRARGGL
jgi:DNA-binding transcriptional MocR family regulator